MIEFIIELIGIAILSGALAYGLATRDKRTDD